MGIQDMDDPKILRNHKWTTNPISGTPKKNMCNIEFKFEEDKFLFLNQAAKDAISNLPNTDPLSQIKIYHDRSPAERKQFQIASQEVTKLNAPLSSDSTHFWIVRDGRPQKIRRKTTPTNQQQA